MELDVTSAAPTRSEHESRSAEQVLVATNSQVALACRDAFARRRPAGQNVLFVGLASTPADCAKRWRTVYPDRSPANLGLVTVGDANNSGRGASTDGSSGGTVRTVAAPSDLTGLGIAVSEFLSEWEGDDTHTVICFDSVTTLLHWAEEDRVFRFLSTMKRYVDRAGASAHYHLTPAAHEERVVETFASLFGAVVEGPSGE